MIDSLINILIGAGIMTAMSLAMALVLLHRRKRSPQEPPEETTSERIKVSVGRADGFYRWPDGSYEYLVPPTIWP